MFSFTHIAIVFIIALLVFGPEKLPEIARVIGKALGDFRRASTDFRRVIEQEFAEIERQTREKEELARQKALEASSRSSGTTPAQTVAADPPAPGASGPTTPAAHADGSAEDRGYPDQSGPAAGATGTHGHTA